MLVNDFLNLVLVYKNIEPRHGRNRTRDFFSTVRVVSFTTCMLSIDLLKHLSIISPRWPLFKKISFRQTNSVCNLVQLEHT